LDWLLDGLLPRARRSPAVPGIPSPWFAALSAGNRDEVRDLVVSVSNAEQRDALVGFLGGCGARPRVLDERSVALDLDDDGCPRLATLVADIDTWRGRARVPEAVLRLGEETRILRTEA
jgi:hypothetical protein